MFKQQTDCSPNGEILFEYPDILIIRKAMDRMTEAVSMAEIRSYYGGTNIYAPFAGMHLMQTTNLPALSHHIVDKKIKTDEPFRRSLDIYLTLLCTEFTERFYLDYKWKPRAAEKQEEAAEEKQQRTATLEVQEEEEKQQDTAKLKSEEDGVVTVEMKHVE
uniref:Uncharacterized protein n=1 Tax=Panagrolaimus davidi TaxID=227884 RepID=A0A914QK63_9BILA